MDGLQNFCYSLLGYNSLHGTQTVSSVVTQTTIETTGSLTAPTTELDDVTVESTHTLSYPAQTVTITPGVTATIEATAIDTSLSTDIVSTVSHTVSQHPKHRARQASDAGIPDALRSYGPSILTLACSVFLGAPSITSNLTTTVASTLVQTSFTHNSFLLFNSTVTMPKDSTISIGKTITRTQTPSTHHVSGTQTLTTTLDYTETSTVLVTES